MSNKAKEWQEGRYYVNVKGGSVEAVKVYTEKVNGFPCYKQKSAIAKCDPRDEFNLAEGVSVAMERLEKRMEPKICEGDKVKVTNTEAVFNGCVDWVLAQIRDGLGLDYAVRYRYGADGINTENRYRVIKVAPHLYAEHTLALIESITPNRFCYVIDMEALEKC